MLTRTKLAAFFLAVLVVAPVLAAGRPACCIKAPVAAASCCSAKSAAHASAPKGCCKTPVAPKPETRMKDPAPTVLVLAAPELGSPSQPSIAMPETVGVRLARLAHHAEAPDDSPPDLLSRIHTLLI